LTGESVFQSPDSPMLESYAISWKSSWASYFPLHSDENLFGGSSILPNYSTVF
jgi:hypothetical protein